MEKSFQLLLKFTMGFFSFFSFFFTGKHPESWIFYLEVTLFYNTIHESNHKNILQV